MFSGNIWLLALITAWRFWYTAPFFTKYFPVLRSMPLPNYCHSLSLLPTPSNVVVLQELCCKRWAPYVHGMYVWGISGRWWWCHRVTVDPELQNAPSNFCPVAVAPAISCLRQLASTDKCIMWPGNAIKVFSLQFCEICLFQVARNNTSKTSIFYAEIKNWQFPLGVSSTCKFKVDGKAPSPLFYTNSTQKMFFVYKGESGESPRSPVTKKKNPPHHQNQIELLLAPHPTTSS